ncbi:MAG: cell filamentation protein Fic [Chlamydiae bacterium RIFCSPHIGHO2_12_FULL_27_8]|nr:MAG: cell filamentation protein Fic [Chlamydiae bacterium RIFCSPHIGHO2_12_FULL_27_8]OGN64826.1 MAG: cell filamentation protein Fic [Chlamydiae bacterium RIFCSPLOWO2_01_FULL_28_7]
MKNDRLQIRNSTVEFLIFTNKDGQDGIEVRVFEETVWLTQKLIAELFDKGRSTIAEHLAHIFEDKELNEKEVCRFFRHTAEDDKEYESKFYNLDAIIAVGFRVNSHRAIQFRQWAISVLRDYAIRGYVLDKERLKNGVFFNKEYFDNLLSEIREIRSSERNFYQKITDIYATAMDYNADSEITKDFFASVQNKFHFAIHGHTAAELIMQRADSKKDRMGLTNWKNSPNGKILKPDVAIAKNYLTEKELKTLNRFVTMYLDYAESQAENNIPMTMEDWARKLKIFLQFNEKDILEHPGKVSQKVAKAFAEGEFEKFRVVQDKLYESDFDRQMKKTLESVDQIQLRSKEKSCVKLDIQTSLKGQEEELLQ